MEYTLIYICIIMFIILGCIKISLDIGEDKVPTQPMPKDQQHAVNKMRKGDLCGFENKLWSNTCPLCGEDMNWHIYGGSDQFSDHWCVHCGFVTKMEVLA